MLFHKTKLDQNLSLSHTPIQQLHSSSASPVSSPNFQIYYFISSYSIRWVIPIESQLGGRLSTLSPFPTVIYILPTNTMHNYDKASRQLPPTLLINFVLPSFSFLSTSWQNDKYTKDAQVSNYTN